MLDWYWYALLILAGFLAGIINTIAGGGSFLTLPALMFICGLDPKMANGTNRIAILFSSGAASFMFHGHGLLNKKLALQLTIPTLAGVPIGAL
ncbi:MAG: sulfite exporter TauE/SafE family protein, partial [Planctomycetota bacterium]